MAMADTHMGSIPYARSQAVLGGSLTHPVDTVRTRMQSGGSFLSTVQKSTKFTKVLKVVLKTDGARVDGRSSGIHRQSRLSAIAAALSSAAPEDNSTSLSSKESGLKLDLNLPRRRLQVSFTCDACGVRSHRLINPTAYARGTVFVQCAGCEVYHKLVDNLGLIEEYDFREEKASKEGEVNMDLVE